MHVARHELGERVHHGDDRLAKVLVPHAGGAPQAACAGHVAAVSGCARTISRHGGPLAVLARPGRDGRSSRNRATDTAKLRVVRPAILRRSYFLSRYGATTSR